jgi:hypothetical protein
VVKASMFCRSVGRQTCGALQACCACGGCSCSGGLSPSHYCLPSPAPLAQTQPAQVVVRQGDQVEEGDPLVVVEAMKMEHTGGWAGDQPCSAALCRVG